MNVQVDFPINFDEKDHTVEAFKYTAQKCRFLKDLQLSVPVDIIPENRYDTAILIEGERLIEKSRDKMVEFQTRAMKNQFQEKFKTSLNELHQLQNSFIQNLH